MHIRVSIVDEPEACANDVSFVISMPASDRGGLFDAETLARLVAALTPPDRSGYRDRIVVKNSGRMLLLKTCDIDWIEAEGNYVLIHVGKDAHMVRETIGGLEGELDPARFCRIHRSIIVNVDRVKELRPQARGDVRVVLETGSHLTLSRGYRDTLLRMLSAD